MIKTVTVAGQQYNIAQQSAVMQKKLLLLIGAKIAFHSATSGIEKIDVSMLVGSLITLPMNTFDEVAAIALYKTVKLGDKDPVTIDNFQGAMVAYTHLLAEAIAHNLDDFFTFLDSGNAARRLEGQNKNQPA